MLSIHQTVQTHSFHFPWLDCWTVPHPSSLTLNLVCGGKSTSLDLQLTGRGPWLWVIEPTNALEKHEKRNREQTNQREIPQFFASLSKQIRIFGLSCRPTDESLYANGCKDFWSVQFAGINVAPGQLWDDHKTSSFLCLIDPYHVFLRSQATQAARSSKFKHSISKLRLPSKGHKPAMPSEPTGNKTLKSLKQWIASIFVLTWGKCWPTEFSSSLGHKMLFCYKW